MAIIKSAVDEKRLKTKEYKLPLVIPIVIYTGKQKWNANKYIEESQEKLEGVKNNLANYNLVDVNNFTEKELIEDETLITKLMLIEKSEDTKETVECIEKIIPKIREEQKELMIRMLGIIFEEKIGKEKTKELINKLKGEDKQMLAVIEMIRKENQMYIDIGKKQGRIEGKKSGKIEGKKEGIMQVVKTMLSKNMPIKLISEITEVPEKEIEKMKNS